MLVHSVYFWFKPDADPAVVASFEAGLARLSAIPDARAAHYGRPAPTEPRPVVDASYAWALILFFDDVAAHDRYQQHPVHDAFVAEFRDSWQSVRVYDARV